MILERVSLEFSSGANRPNHFSLQRKAFAFGEAFFVECTMHTRSSLQSSVLGCTRIVLHARCQYLFAVCCQETITFESLRLNISRVYQEYPRSSLIVSVFFVWPKSMVFTHEMAQKTFGGTKSQGPKHVAVLCMRCIRAGNITTKVGSNVYFFEDMLITGRYPKREKR